MFDIPQDFLYFIDEMKKEHDKNNQNIREFLDKMKSNKNIIINIPFYRIHLNVNYLELFMKYNHFIKN